MNLKLLSLEIILLFTSALSISSLDWKGSGGLTNDRDLLDESSKVNSVLYLEGSQLFRPTANMSSFLYGDLYINQPNTGNGEIEALFKNLWSYRRNQYFFGLTPQLRYSLDEERNQQIDFTPDLQIQRDWQSFSLSFLSHLKMSLTTREFTSTAFFLEGEGMLGYSSIYTLTAGSHYYPDLMEWKKETAAQLVYFSLKGWALTLTADLFFINSPTQFCLTPELDIPLKGRALLSLSSLLIWEDTSTMETLTWDPEIWLNIPISKNFNIEPKAAIHILENLTNQERDEIQISYGIFLKWVSD